MTKRMYVGPSIDCVATRNTVYEDLPEGLEAAIQKRPYLSGLCVPINKVSSALQQINGKTGGIYTLYKKALADSAEIKKGAI